MKQLIFLLFLPVLGLSQNWDSIAEETTLATNTKYDKLFDEADRVFDGDNNLGKLCSYPIVKDRQKLKGTNYYFYEIHLGTESETYKVYYISKQLFKIDQELKFENKD